MEILSIFTSNPPLLKKKKKKRKEIEKSEPVLYFEDCE